MRITFILISLSAMILASVKMLIEIQRRQSQLNEQGEGTNKGRDFTN
jgi:hypothetical protein